MEPFKILTGVVVPMDRTNVDTDAIIPKQFLKSIRRTGFGPNLFDEWRYLDQGVPGGDHRGRPLNPDFVLNQPRYQGASILLARDNFGCGSSREHAPWALRDYGFRVLIAPSFADIFCQNCFKNGMLPIVLDGAVVDLLFRETWAVAGYSLTIDLERLLITTPAGGREIPFVMDAFRRDCLLRGQDEIDLTLRHLGEIEQFEARCRRDAPWLAVQPGG